MKPRVKRRFTYAIIGSFFLLQGVEYAVILPTLWLYLEERFQAPSYFLGLILSSYSLTSLLAAPVMGRWSDVSRNTKLILLIANWFQVGGSLMYTAGLSVWMLVGARLVAGVGAGVGAAFFADITRVTSTEARTGVMSMFMAVRQLGLLVGPGCNLFLRQFNFTILGIKVDKFNAPGIFMAVMWLIHEVAALFLYWNLPKLKLQEDLESLEEERPTRASTPTPLDEDSPGLAVDSPPPEPGLLTGEATSYSSQQHSGVAGTDATDLKSHLNGNTEGDARVTDIVQCVDNVRYSNAVADRSVGGVDCEDFYTASNENIEEAEKYMSGSVASSPISHPSSLGTGEMVFTENYYSAPSPRRQRPMPFHRPSVLSGGAFGSVNGEEERASGGGSGRRLGGTGSGNTPKLTFQFFKSEFVREEIIALLFTTFVAFFNQVGMETLLTPMTQKLLGWGELEISILFCVAGVEILLVFLLIRWMSRRVSDRWLLIIGFSLETTTIAICTWFVPNPPASLTGRMVGLISLSFVDVLGLPFLAVSSASLYSKMTNIETQGFAQGIRRSFVGIALILGPLWSGSLLHNFAANFGVMLAINAVAMVLLLLSFKHLVIPETTVPKSASNGRLSQTASAEYVTTETTPLISQPD